MIEVSLLFPSVFQSTVADVFHCVFHGRNDPNEPDRRQVGADPIELFSISQLSGMSVIVDMGTGQKY